MFPTYTNHRFLLTAPVGMSEIIVILPDPVRLYRWFRSRTSEEDSPPSHESTLWQENGRPTASGRLTQLREISLLVSLRAPTRGEGRTLDPQLRQRAQRVFRELRAAEAACGSHIPGTTCAFKTAVNDHCRKASEACSTGTAPKHIEQAFIMRDIVNAFHDELVSHQGVEARN